MAYCVKPVHARPFQQNCANDVQQDIYQNNVLGDIADFGQEFFFNVRVLLVEDVHAADSQKRQQRDPKKDDDDAADAVKHGAPEQDGFWLRLNIA